jgi:hypothetical protein
LRREVLEVHLFHQSIQLKWSQRLLCRLTPELSRAAQWRKLCASVAQAQR